MTTPPANGHFPIWLRGVISLVQIIAIPWMGWVSFELMEAKADRAVLNQRVMRIDRQVGDISVDFMQSQIVTLQTRVRELEVAGSDRGGT